MPTAKKSAAYRRRGAAGMLTLHGAIDMFEASALHEIAQKALADTPATTVTVDLAGANRLDLSALQIIFAMRRDLTKAGRSVDITAPTDRVLADAATAGVAL